MNPPMYSRRAVLKQALVSAGACSALSSFACATRPSLIRDRFGRLMPVQVSRDRIIRTVVGLRPFRRTGFRVAVEAFGEKQIIHNYGHGGGGVTLSWGTAHLAVALMRGVENQCVSVLGCGAVGLATARLLQDGGFTVTIYARDLPPNTTSNIAGAQWAPVTIADEDARSSSFDAALLEASRFANRYYQTLVGPKYGVSWLDNFVLSAASEVGLPWEVRHIAAIMPTTVVRPGDHPFGPYHARHFMTMLIEPSVYLRAILEDFRIAGGRVVVRSFASLQAILALPDRWIFNCTGLDAGRLFNDVDVIPIKGQLTFLAPQPDVNYITIGPGNIGMMPRRDGILLGGTHERGNATLDPNPTDIDRVLRGHEELFAAMR